MAIIELDFLQAALIGNLTIIQTYCQQGGDLQAVQGQALLGSAAHGHFQVVQYLLKNVANIHAQSDQALTLSAKYGHLPVVQCLIQHGADISVGLKAAQHQPHILSWLKDYQRMQDEGVVLSAVDTLHAPKPKPQRF